MRTGAAAVSEVSLDTWREAFEAVPDASVFASSEWVEAFGRTFGLRHRCIGFHDETGFGMAHLGPRRSGGATVLSASSPDDLMDYTDVLLSSPASADQLVRILTALPGVDAVEFEQAPERGQVWEVARRWPVPVTAIPTSVCPQIDAASFDDLTTVLPGRRRRDFTRQARRLEKLGVSLALTDRPESVDDMLALHVQHWRGRGLNPQHTTAAFRRLLLDLLRTGRARLVRADLAHERLGYTFWLMDRTRLRNYLVAYNRDVEVTVSHNVLELVMAYTCLPAPMEGIDFLRGAHPEKVRYSTSVTQNHRLVLPVPGSVRGHAFAACGVLRPALARSGAADWGRGVRDGARRLAGKATASGLRPGRSRW